MSKDPKPAATQEWEKRSHNKTAVNAPTIRLTAANEHTVTAVPVNFFNQYGFTGREPRIMRVSTLLASWRARPTE